MGRPRKVISLNLLFLLTSTVIFAGWARTYGGDQSDVGYHIIKTNEGNYVIAGSTKSFGPIYKAETAWLVKIDSSGDTLWTHTYTGNSVEFVEARMIFEENNGYVAIGAAYPGLWLLKTNKDGDMLWARTYAPSSNRAQTSYIEKTRDGGFVITGSIRPEFDEYVWLLKTDSLGDTLWTKIYDTEYGGGYGAFVDETDDAGYMILGWKEEMVNDSEMFKKDIWILRTDSLGDTLWTKTIGQDRYHDRVDCACANEDGGYTFFAYLDSATCLVKIDSLGNIISQKKYDAFSPSSFKMLADGGYIVCGHKGEEAFIKRLDSAGNEVWTRYYGGANLDYFSCIELIGDGGYIAVGSTSSWGAGEGDLWVIKTDSLGLLGISEPSSETPVTHLETTNPIASEVTLRYSNCTGGFHARVFDASGREIDRIESSSISGTIQWGERQSPGVYFIRSTSSPVSTIQRVVLLK